jgi:hypothetical protein
VTDRPAFPDGLRAFHGCDWAPVVAETELGLHLAQLAAAMPFAAVRALDAMGMPRDVLNAMVLAGDLARARVAIGKGGLFEFDGPDAALLIAVREAGQVIDVCAVRSAQPDEWAVLRGEGWLLGHAAFLRCLLDGEGELRVRGNPIDWLVGGAEGICVLDWSAAALGSLRGLGPKVTLICDDMRAAERLGAVLAWDGLPKVRSLDAVGEMNGRMAA